MWHYLWLPLVTTVLVPCATVAFGVLKTFPLPEESSLHGWLAETRNWPLRSLNWTLCATIRKFRFQVLALSARRQRQSWSLQDVSRCCGYGDLQHLNGHSELLTRGDDALKIQGCQRCLIYVHYWSNVCNSNNFILCYNIQLTFQRGNTVLYSTFHI